MIHVLQDDVKSILIDQTIDELHSSPVGSDLSPEIRFDVAEAPGPAASFVFGWLFDEQAHELISLVFALVDHLERDDGSTFLEEGLRSRRHRARQDSANVCSDLSNQLCAFVKGAEETILPA